jgi:hypothetical protein
LRRDLCVPRLDMMVQISTLVQSCLRCSMASWRHITHAPRRAPRRIGFHAASRTHVRSASHRMHSSRSSAHRASRARAHVRIASRPHLASRIAPRSSSRSSRIALITPRHSAAHRPHTHPHRLSGCSTSYEDVLPRDTCSLTMVFRGASCAYARARTGWATLPEIVIVGC